ncbi:hypothetical protein CJD36_019865 [Flavipsychrobacter stenotrophus]|uniref:DUF2586 domain-containing protein n=1 Tax=Flavipsychrobacter stenotrophus TaxID=2077091 RepID=A0A2S7SRG8_9BACT|nr:DUF2586 family protein [Flavipsychrobacter stenotrophus]PQJ09499.1 hypothetical protein CJD36_019865 [Flavipsychrobacter stenotrophus]
MSGVNITLANGQLGSTLQTADGVCGMIITGVPEGDYAVGTPKLITSMDDLLGLGITKDGNPFAFKQIKEFYDEAGKGAQLYFLLTANTATYDSMLPFVPTLLDYAQGKICFGGLMCDDNAVYDGEQTTNDAINDDYSGALIGLQSICSEYATGQKPLRFILGGTSYNGTVADLADLTQLAHNRVAILIGDTVASASAALGMLLGRLASVPVMRKVSRVRTGALTAAEAYLGADALETLPNDPALIAAKGYITLTTYPNVGGYFFSGDDTASATTDDYHFLSRGRVIDKVQKLTYATFVQEVDDEVFVVEGKLDVGYCKTISQKVENQINNTMTINREISSVTCKINPNQNILSTNVLNVELSIVPVGYATTIDIKLGFDNPAL